MREAIHNFNILASTLSRCSPGAELGRYRQDIDLLNDKRRLLLESKITSGRASIANNTRTAALLDPRDVLRRGYAIVSAGDTDGGERIASTSAARNATKLRITFSDGTMEATPRPRKESS